MAVCAAISTRIEGDAEEVEDVPETREERIMAACDCVIDLASILFGVSGKELRRQGRCGSEVSRVRQIAMYVAHVVLQLNMTELGKGFARDRTTALYACHLVEDLRDDPEFDAIVVKTERIVAAAFRGRPL